MKRFYVFKGGMQQGSMSSKEEAIELIRRRQKRETHPILRSEYSIIEGEEEFIPRTLADDLKQAAGIFQPAGVGMHEDAAVVVFFRNVDKARGHIL